MVAKSSNQGYSIFYDKKDHIWKFSDTKKKSDDSRPCKVCGRGLVPVKLFKEREFSGLKTAKVDACIAPLVQLLNDYGVHTVNCCCGHGTRKGEIIFIQDNKRQILRLKKGG